MIRITALNDCNEYVNGSQRSCVQISTTKEALESEAIALYNKGLNFLNQGQTKQAIQVLIDVLNSPFLQEATFSNPEDGISHSAELLKYSAYKNLAEMSEKEDSKVVAMEYYIEAVTVDSTDVTVWFKMGRLAIGLENFSLARHAFEMGLQCNANHWPCLDNIISLMYALNNYEACLHYIARALGLDPGCAKGLVFMRRIFSEHPGLRSWSMDIFLKCDQSIYVTDIGDEEAEEYIREAVAIRLRKQELCKSPELLSVTFTQPLASFTWKSLGERLLDLYDHVSQKVKEQIDISQPGISLASHVDLTADVLPLTSADVGSDPSPPPPPLTIQSQTPCVDVAPPCTTVSEPIPSTPTLDPVVSLSVVEVGSGVEMEDVTSSGGRKRGRKRRSVFADEPECKRRSARVKNPGKSSVEGPITYQEVLYKLLPKALLRNADDCQMTSDLCQLDVTSGGDDKSKDPCDQTCSSEKMENEKEDVQKFIDEHKTNNGLINLITKFLIRLASSSNLIWPAGLTDVYLKLYQRLRKHIVYPNYFSNDAADEWIQKMAKMSLLHKELKLDRWLTSNINIIQPSRKSPVAGVMGPNFPGKYFESDFEYLVGLSGLSDRLGDFWLEFCIRVFWLQARYFLLQNNMEMATDCFEKTAEYVRMLNDSSRASVCLTNCTSGRIISLRELEQQLDSLRRCQSMDELRRLADSGQHGKVIDVLLPASVAAKDLDIERMKLLQESIAASKEYRRGLVWAEEYFHETLRRYKSTTSGSQKDVCKDVMMQLVVTLNQFLDGDPSVLSSVPGHWMFRLSHDLLDVINISLDVPESAVGMALEAVTPWIILYKLIRHCEETETSANDDEALSSSLSLIIYAHEYLGRRSWCMTHDGELLLFVVQVLTEELDKYSSDDPHPFEEDLDNAVQQCFFCLYGHRSKKAKYLDDHNVPQIPLTLERCQRVFDFFKPKTLPEYDSYKMNAISAELEALLKRIFPLIPQMNNSGIEADINAYIDGATSTPPCVPADRDVKYPLVKELYYLLADYYFKNKEQLKAIKFYMYDICINPARFDSWAGMALARSSRLETKLISHDLKQEASLQKQAFSTLRSFKRAMELDDSNVKLWIEYGSCAYQLHSHASRLLKQTKFSPLSKETIDLATSSKIEMLMVALNCYIQAEACALESGNKEEKWLLHYMLGKIAEKLDQDPSIYLEHYKKASYFLHEDKAKYPKKISYFSPPHLSVEALEMYYRTHVCIVKYLMKYEKELDKIPFDVFESYIKDASNSPLTNCAEKEKKHDKKSELADSKETAGGRGGVQSSCNDHNYSKQKVSTQSANSGTAGSKDAVASCDASLLLSTSVTAPLSYPSSSEDVAAIAVGGNSNAARLSTPGEEAELELLDGNVQSSSLKMDDQPLDLTVHPSSVASLMEKEAQVAALPSGKSQPGMVDLEICPKKEADMEVTVNQPQADNPVSQPEVGCGSRQDATPSVANASPSTERKSDAEALDELISTLAAVQKSLENENKVETVLKTEEKEDNKSEVTAPFAEPAFVNTEEVPENFTETFRKAESPSKGVPVEVELVHIAADVKTEKPEEPMDTEVPLDGINGPVRENADKAEAQEEKDQVSGQPVPSFGPKDQAKAVEGPVASHQQLTKRFISMMNDCMRALFLCQTRFPEHFKSIYRLAYICFYSNRYKDVGRCKELLLGGGLTHTGLFLERKLNNFFNGLWRNPVQDLDRWGSFSAHLNRALLLLFEVLTVTRDSRLLFSLHQHLCRAPVDIGKKYLRDTDRIQLARMAFKLCCKAVEAQVRQFESSKGASSLSRPDKRFLLHVCLVRQQSHKLNTNVKELDDLLVTTYGLCDDSEITGPLTEDAIQHHFALMQLPKLPQFGSFEREGRHMPLGSHLPMTSAMAMNMVSNRFGLRLPAATAAMSLQVEKAFQVPYRPVQRPLFQPDKAQKPSASAALENDIEIIDLSADDSAQVINVSSSAEDEMLAAEVEPPNSLSEESGGSKGVNDIKKEEKSSVCSGSEKDVSRVDALPKDISKLGASRNDAAKELASSKDDSKAITSSSDILTSSNDISKVAAYPMELFRTRASPKELVRAIASPKEFARAVDSQKVISKSIPSQKITMTSASVTATSKAAPAPAFLKTSTSAKGPRLVKENLQFYSVSKSSMLDKPAHKAGESLRTEPCRKASVPPSLMSNVDLLSTLPQETRDLLTAPQKNMQQQASAGNKPSNVASKWSLASQSNRKSQAPVRVQPLSPSPSELSSSNLSDNDDEKDDVIELSSSNESDN